MEENLQPSETTQTTQMSDKAKKNIGVIVSFFVVLLVVSVVLISRLYPHAKQQEQLTTNAASPVANVLYQNKISPKPTLDTSDAQLDKDLQDAQNSLNTLDTGITNSAQ